MSGWLSVCGKIEVDKSGLEYLLSQCRQKQTIPNCNQTQLVEQRISQVIKCSYIKTFDELPCLDNVCTFVFDYLYHSKDTTLINKRHKRPYKTIGSSRLMVYINIVVCDYTIVSGEKFVETIFNALKSDRCLITNRTVVNVIGEGIEATLYVGETKYGVQLEN